MCHQIQTKETRDHDLNIRKGWTLSRKEWNKTNKGRFWCCMIQFSRKRWKFWIALSETAPACLRQDYNCFKVIENYSSNRRPHRSATMEIRESQRCLIKIMNKVGPIDTCWTQSPANREYAFRFSAHGALIKRSIPRSLSKFPEVGITWEGWWCRYTMAGTVRTFSSLGGPSSA